MPPWRGAGTASSDSPPAGRASPPPRPHPGLALTLTALRLSSFTTPLLFPAPTPRVAVGLRSELLSSLDSGGLSGPRSRTSGLQGRQISFLGACFLLISVSSVLPGLTPYACDCLFSPEAALKEPHSEPGGGAGSPHFLPLPEALRHHHAPAHVLRGRSARRRKSRLWPSRPRRTKDHRPGAPGPHSGRPASSRRSAGLSELRQAQWWRCETCASRLGQSPGNRGPRPILKGAATPPRSCRASVPV